MGWMRMMRRVVRGVMASEGIGDDGRLGGLDEIVIPGNWRTAIFTGMNRNRLANKLSISYHSMHPMNAVTSE